MDDRTQQLIVECKRQEEACLCASIAIFDWLKVLRFWRIVFVIAPIILTGTATVQLIAEQAQWKWFAVASALLAGIMPAVYKALNLDVSLSALADSAHRFTLLRDRFRQASAVTALGGSDAFKSEFADLMARMDAARCSGLTPPQRFFKRARMTVSKGHYDFHVDQLSPAQPPPSAGSNTNLMQMTTPRKLPNSV
jgi:hypothetical protein